MEIVSGAGAADRPLRGGPTRLSLVDGLRGFAALAVLVYHYVHFFMSGPDHHRIDGFRALYPAREMFGLFYDYGFLAVQVFWMISGFVFAFVYYGREASTREFVVNRIARLYPLHLLTLLLVAVLQFVALERLGYTLLFGNFDGVHFGLQLFMASDWLRGTGYSFNGPIWSVSVEIAVYAVFWLTARAAGRMGLPLVLALVAGFLLAHASLWEFTRVFSCGAYFFTGSALCLVWRGRWGRGASGNVLVAVLIAAGYAGLRDGRNEAWMCLAVPGFAGAAILVLARAEAGVTPWFARLCQWLGDNTYGVYLWHVPLQLMALLLILPAGDPAQWARSGWFLAAFIGVTIGVARLSFVHFEKPMRNQVRAWLMPPFPVLPGAVANGGVTGAPSSPKGAASHSASQSESECRT